MYMIKNLNSRQLAYLKNALPNVVKMRIVGGSAFGDSTLAVRLQNGAAVSVNADAGDQKYYASITDDAHGYEDVDSIGEDNIYDAIKGEIVADADWVDMQTYHSLTVMPALES